MLKRIYADNFKCLVNFDWQPGQSYINLMLGPNGSGKTTVFDCIESIRAFATGEAKVDALFPSSSLTMWQKVSKQSFEIELDRAGSVYRYELGIEHSEKRTHKWVSHELLYFEGKPLLEFKDGEVTLYGENFSQPIGKYPLDRSFSALSLIPDSGLYSLFTWFKIALERTIILQIVPPMMEESSVKTTNRPLRYFQNFASWYRSVSQDQGAAFRLHQELKDIIPGFSHFKFERVGEEATVLKAVFDQKGRKQAATNFSSLSDGQRMLIALYALLHSLRVPPEGLDLGRDLPSALLCLDEPDNFIASREIQPWLVAVQEELRETKSRLLLISHHPESIDYALIPSTGEDFSSFWFSRGENLHTRVQPVDPEQVGGLKPSELAARGWLKV